MIYTKMTKKAIKLMFENQKNQYDKSGIPYVFHPFHVAEKMTDEETTIVALLHDIVEDTDISCEDLLKDGFSENVVNALGLLTHNDNEDYYTYVKRISTNDIARIVKISDLEHNMDLSRLDEISQDDLERLEKYKRCYSYLCEVEQNFRQNKDFVLQ